MIRLPSAGRRPAHVRATVGVWPHRRRIPLARRHRFARLRFDAPTHLQGFADKRVRLWSDMQTVLREYHGAIKVRTDRPFNGSPLSISHRRQVT